MSEQSVMQLRAALVQLAQGSIEQGILHEPRGYFDVITLDPDGNETAGHPDVFKNGEDFPVTLTHMAMMVGPVDIDGDPDDERNIQRILMRMVWHSQYYMNQFMLPVPLWSNKIVAGPNAEEDGGSSWDFDVPFVLSSRDTLMIRVGLVEQPEAEVQVTISLSGVGLLSGRPYFLTGQTTMSSPEETTLQNVDFRNDGSEPILVSTAKFLLSAPTDTVDPTADIRNLLVNIRQVGNGTNADWFEGPDTLPGPELMPASLCGVTVGRAVVHKFPGDGMVLEPGEGVNLFAQGVTDGEDPFPSIFNIALLGYITVT